MNDERKTKAQLIAELRELRTQLTSCPPDSGESRYRAMFEHMTSGFAVFQAHDDGADFIYTDFNPAAERLNGLRREDVLGRRLTLVLPETEQAGLLEAMRRVWRSGLSEHTPALFYSGPRIHGWREYDIYKLPSGSVAIIIDDVSPRMQAERQARHKTTELQATLDAVNDGLWRYDIAEGRFHCSDRLAAMIGCRDHPEPCPNPFCSSLLHPDDRERLWQSLAQCADGECLRLGMELRLREPDGNWKWFYARGSVVEDQDSGIPRRIIGAHTDLTHFKRAEEQLKESLELFASIFESSYTAMLLIDPETGRIVEANAKACAFYGYPRETLTSMTIQQINILSPEDVRAEMEKAKRLHRNFFHFTHRLASGELRTVEVYSGPVRIRGKSLLYSIIHDITDRLQAESALHRSESLMSAIFRAAPVGIGTVTDRVLGTVNDVLCRMLGYEAHELGGQSASMLYPNTEEFLRVGQARHPLIERFGSGSLETVFKRKDGSQLNVLLGSSSLDPDNPQGSLVFTVLDITARKQAEEELSRGRRAMHQLVDAMPSALFMVDSEGRITLCNGAAQNLCGCAAKDLAGKAFSLALPGFSGFEGMLRNVMERAAPLLRKALPRNVAGRLRHWDMLIYPLEEFGAGRAVVRLDDVTERILMEEAMIQNEKMMSVGGLAAGMAHEINNPLAGILQGAQNILRRLDPGLPANVEVAKDENCDMKAMLSYLEQRKVFRFLDGIIVSGNRAAAIVSNMLDFASGGESARTDLDINQCLKSTLNLVANGYDLRRGYDFRSIVIDQELAPSLPRISGVGAELQQVFLNLLTNAAYAMSGKVYTDALPRIVLRTRADKDAVVVEIEDNGPGIPLEQQGRVFDPFFTTKPPGDGTGLGLSVSFFIITRNHGGTISLQSEPGVFTRFTIRLPLRQARPGAPVGQ